MTDFRALCQQLMDAIDSGIPSQQLKQSPLAVCVDAALAQPEPQGATDKELHQLWLDLYAFHEGPTSGDVAEIARAALARWGTPANNTREES
jgi:hypothetical protein